MRNTLLCICIVIFLPLYLLGVELTSQERDYLQKLGSIKVCVDPDWAPFETLSAKGEYVGIGADLLFLVAQRLGLNVEILHTKDWDETMIASKEGKCQIMSFLNQTLQEINGLFLLSLILVTLMSLSHEKNILLSQILASLSIKPLFSQRERRWKRKSVKNIPISR